MFESIQRHENGSESAVAVDIAPLIDMVFILLIFFLVTTTFARETGITVKKPEAIETQALRPESMRISIAESGAVYTDGRQVDLAECREAVRRYMAQERNGAVIIVPDEDVRARRLVSVMDAAKQGGAKEIAVATRRKERP
jgi:biopolymer transport protein ExbD